MTFSRLTLGEPRLRGKVHGGEVTEPCSFPARTGSQLLADPGFESWISATGITEIARRSGQNYVEPSNTSNVLDTWREGELADLTWVQQGARKIDFSDAFFEVISTSPHSGTYHARLIMENGAAWLMPGAYMHCLSLESPLFAPAAQVDKVSAGDVVEASAWAKADNLGQQGYFRLYIQGYDQDMSFVGNLNGGGFPAINSLTGSYVEYTESATVPSGISYVQVLYHCTVEQFPDPTDNVTFDIDDAVYSIQ